MSNYERVRRGSSPGLTGVYDWRAIGLRLARMAQAGVRPAAVGGESREAPGGAVGAAGPGGRVCYLWAGHEGRCIFRRPSSCAPWEGGNCGRPEVAELERQQAVSRLAAAADDAEDLARGLGAEALGLLATITRGLPAGSELRLQPWAVAFDGRVGRLARVAVRCADQAVALRALADAVQTTAEEDGDTWEEDTEHPARGLYPVPGGGQ